MRNIYFRKGSEFSRIERNYNLNKLKISFIIFSYNEEKNIAGVIASVVSIAQTLSESYEIIVVDDGSTDGTVEVIMEFNGVKKIIHQTNKGIGMALLSGYRESKMEYVCAIPGDGQFDAGELLIIKPFDNKTFYSFYRPQTNYSFYRKLLNSFNRIFNHIVLGISIRDVNWIKVYKKEQLDSIGIELSSSILESEICAKLIKSGCKVIELPSTYHNRKFGDSKGGSWKTLSKAIKEMFKLYISVKKFKGDRTL
jgi:dolichol-phosphate mannosyltransferase